MQQGPDDVASADQAAPGAASRLNVSLYRPGSDQSSVTLLFISPDDRGTGLRRYADAVSPDYRCLMVDMGSVLHDRCLPYPAEDRACHIAAETKRLLRQNDFFIVVGYCLAGTVAALVASRLDRCRGLILVDSPMPGHPYPYPGMAYLPWAARYFRQVNRWRLEKKVASNSRHAFKRKLLWHGLRLSRPFLGRYWPHPRMQQLFRKVNQNDVWLFPAVPAQRWPIVHFVCADQSSLIMKEAIHGWRSRARTGIEIIPIAGDHNGAFFRPNLPILVDGLEHLLRTCTPASGR